MKNKKLKKVEFIVFAVLAFLSTSLMVEQLIKNHKANFEVQRTVYKFYIKDEDGVYQPQEGRTLPGEGYYLNVEKTNSECTRGVIGQNDDLSVYALINFSTICNLYYDRNGVLTIDSNVDSAVATIKNGDTVIATGTVPLSTGIRKGKTVTITVSDPEYYYTETSGTYNDYEETYVMTAEDTTKTITLNERPWITGSIANTSSTTARTYTTTNWHPGYYLVEAWGGHGGVGDDDNTNGGPNGYVYGVVYIPYNTKVYSTAGGNGGQDRGLAPGGANGGGTGGENNSSGLSGHRGGGGGYSAFAVGGTTINQTNINNGIVKIIAGGGGGSSARGQTLSTQAGGEGGTGGTMSSTKTTITAGTVFSGSNGSAVSGSAYGRGGGTSGGASGGSSATSGSLLTGGNADKRGGGGGAGYYGGGGGYVANAITNSGAGGGGGGSSFIANGVTYSNLPSSITSKLTSTNPSSTGGAIKIQWIGKTLPS